MKKILVIEDQEDILDDIKILLTAEGFKVFTAITGEDGILLAKSNLPDLILCDIMLPGIDGYEVFTELSGSDQTSHIPFIFLTAKVDKRDFRKGMELGADDYIFKPYDAEELIKAVDTRLKKHAALKEKIIHTLAQTPVHSSTHKLNIGDSIFVTHNKTTLPVRLDQIIYIQAENQYTKIVCENRKSYLIRKSLNDWKKVLPVKNFIRIHRAVIIQINYFESMNKNTKQKYEIRLRNTPAQFEISRTYLKNFKNALQQK